MKDLQEEFKYFIDNHDEIFKMYPNRFLVIQDKKIVYAKESFEEALTFAVDNGMQLGTFLIQQCTEGDSAYTQTFHSRAIFA